MKIAPTNVGIPNVSIVKAYSFCDDADGISVDCMAWHRKVRRLPALKKHKMIPPAELSEQAGGRRSFGGWDRFTTGYLVPKYDQASPYDCCIFTLTNVKSIVKINIKNDSELFSKTLTNEVKESFFD